MIECFITRTRTVLFWQKDPQTQQNAIENLSAKALFNYLKTLSPEELSEELKVIRDKYLALSKSINALEHTLTTKRMPFWPKTKIASSAISSLFGMSLRYGYDWLFNNNETMVNTLARGSSNLIIGISSLYMFNFLQSQNETEKLEKEIEMLNKEWLMYREILQKFNLTDPALSSTTRKIDAHQSLNYQ